MTHAKLFTASEHGPGNITSDVLFLEHLLGRAEIDIMDRWTSDNFPGQVFYMVLEPTNSRNFRVILQRRTKLLKAFKDFVNKNYVDGNQTKEQFIHYWIAIIMELFGTNDIKIGEQYTLENLEALVNEQL